MVDAVKPSSGGAEKALIMTQKFLGLQSRGVSVHRGLIEAEKCLRDLCDWEVKFEWQDIMGGVEPRPQMTTEWSRVEVVKYLKYLFIQVFKK